MAPTSSPGCDFENWLPQAEASRTSAHSLQLPQKLAVVRPGKGPIWSSASLKTSFIRKRATWNEAVRDVAESSALFPMPGAGDSSKEYGSSSKEAGGVLGTIHGITSVGALQKLKVPCKADQRDFSMSISLQQEGMIYHLLLGSP